MRDLREHMKLAILTVAAFAATMCAYAEGAHARASGEASCLSSSSR